jgi:predicted site-specific integrase-resolvase
VHQHRRLGVAVGLGAVKQDLDRQIDALTATGIPAERIYLDKKSGSTVDRPGLLKIHARGLYRKSSPYATSGTRLWA